MEEKGIISPVIELRLKYHNPLYFGDSYYIEIQVVKPPKASLELTYKVFNQNDQLACSGYSKLAFLLAETKKLIPVPSYLASKLEIEK